MVIRATPNTMTLTYLLLVLTLTFGIVRSHDNVEAVDSAEEIMSRVRRQADDSCQLADIVFVLDSSGSIGLADWDRVLNFTKSIVSDFVIGSNNVHIGVNYYGNSAILAFNLDTYDTEADVMDAIDGIPWLDQNTNTSGGIRLMHRDMFTVGGGARANAPWIGIVITDGESTFDKEFTIPEADIARTRGIAMFAIGIGEAISQDELIGIANTPVGDEQYVFNAESFEALGAIRQAVVSTTCAVAADCTASGDIVLILDSSGSVGQVHFNDMKTFVRNMIKEAAINEGDTRMGLMTYGNNADIKWDLNTFGTRAEMDLALTNNVLYSAGTTNTAAALSLARNTMFTSGRGDRAGFNNVIVLFTDGGSDNFINTLSEARLTRLAGIKIFVVAVTTWVNTIEIKEIASDPDDKNAFFVSDFNEIFSIFQPLKRAVCGNADECFDSPCNNGGTCFDDISQYLCICPAGWAGQDCDIQCPNPANVMIVLDSSASIGRLPYYSIQDYAKHLIRNLNLEATTSGQAVGLITFSNQAMIRIPLNQYTSKGQMIDAMSYPFMDSTTNSAEAIRRVVDDSFDNQNPGARKIALIITDGQSSDRTQAFKEAARAHSADISILAVGMYVKGKFARQELNSFASDPDQENFMEVSPDTPDQIYALTDSIVKTICNDIDECSPNPCLGGGTCVDRLHGYECRCTNGRSGINCERECDGELDVVFLIDSSGSIHEDRYAIVLDFVANVTNLLETRPGRTHIGALTFADNAVLDMPIGQYQQKEDVLYALKSMTYRRGSTNTADALQMLYNQMYTQANGDRDGVPNVAFIITDGLSTINPQNTIPQAIQARINGIHLIVGSVENDANSLELKGIANRPAADNIFNVNRFGQMPTMVDGLSMALCDNLNECSSNPCVTGICVDGLHSYRCICPNQQTGQNCQRTCTKRMDVVLILDASGSMENFEFTQDASRYIAMGLNFNSDRIRVSVVTYQAEATVRFRLDAYTTQLEVLNAMSFNHDRDIRGTNTAAAIETTRNDVFTMARGDRNGVDNVMLLFSDGESNLGVGNLNRQVLFARQENIKILSVGIGNSVSRSELEQIADSPSTENVFVIQNTGQIESVGDQVLDRLCSI